ncbi:TetR/AcrR family transcriptional regulator [Demequina capsici]|uniref:TetR/AcrR family transcriptional regulator n=1 Tax=Demequina capsici TaxID=3075620 RepID=A0AA96J733_9MICO|nr:TetR/AcrR family transcriptional regulator [Demequina sp. OYTSA14]WNM24777.1 TetR/AcrR family transcriptional regulator [Demequina sp. OYTSA14]
MPLTDDVTVRRRESRQAAASALRREQILDAAVEAFSDKGFNGTSIRDVAARAHLSHTGVLHHFPDKTALLEAVLDRAVHRAGDEFELDAGDGATFMRGFVALAARDASRGVDAPETRMFRMISAEALSPTHPAHGYMRRWYSEVRGHATAALKDLADRGLLRIPREDIPLAAGQIAGLRDGLDPQWLLDPDSVDLVAAVRDQLRRYADIGL